MQTNNGCYAINLPPNLTHALRVQDLSKVTYLFTCKGKICKYYIHFKLKYIQNVTRQSIIRNAGICGFVIKGESLKLLFMKEYRDVRNHQCVLLSQGWQKVQ